ncbi:MAG TPA: styrene monooxygenase/indole monooxygenase family protein [Thermoanaerobaculia bacterium]|jgi:2-polyprenyl-6-methoxyphenol hydroxylase-like FAD-dependent oxidoreductase|nr:styrene monooxygenase/indole monooxygenase family protein [Thermoanaerobaculia bacterium]
MRSIAIIGSGIVGLVAAHGLRRVGYPVTLYSDRTADQWLNESKPTGTAARFELALSYERELGLNHWDDVLPKGEGVFLTFCPTLHNRLVTLLGRGERPFQAVDLRLQCHRWMNDFDGELRIEQITVPRLDEIAREHDLTIVAAGRADLCRLFERDAARSVYDAPRRNLAMVIVRGMRMAVEGCPFLPVKFDFLGTDGELFFIPYWHRDHGQTWNMLFEAKPGSRMDRFGEAKSGEEAVAIAKQVIRELFPWHAEWVREMELADPNGWLTGRVTPMVRRPVGTLPSGRIVTALGDTAISFDPIAAQGANTGVKHARHLVEAIVARERRPFDAEWMTKTFETFFADQAGEACAFSNLLLEDITPAAQEILIAQYGSDGRAANRSGKQRIADAFFANFNDPRTLTPTLTDLPRARRFIAMTSGRPWLWNAARGRAAVARDQVRQKLRVSG